MIHKELKIYSFPTIDQCVDFLESIGAKWNYEKETILNKNSYYKHNYSLVLYDPFNLLG